MSGRQKQVPAEARPGGPILIGLGANLPSPEHGPPVATLEAAVAALAARGLAIRARSRWWESAPVPISDQPWYVNGVVEVETALAPEALLALLHEVEAEFGRHRSVPNAPRVLDLDLLAYGRLVRPGLRRPCCLTPGWPIAPSYSIPCAMSGRTGATPGPASAWQR